MPDSTDLFAALEAAQCEIHEDRQRLEAREAALERAREELEFVMGIVNGSSTAAPPVPRLQRSRAGLTQKAAQMHVDAIVDYLAKHGPSRQADIAKGLRLNSGTVSLALRKLSADDMVDALPEKERGSVVWQLQARARERSAIQ